MPRGLLSAGYREALGTQAFEEDACPPPCLDATLLRTPGLQPRARGCSRATASAFHAADTWLPGPRRGSRAVASDFLASANSKVRAPAARRTAFSPAPPAPASGADGANQQAERQAGEALLGLAQTAAQTSAQGEAQAALVPKPVNPHWENTEDSPQVTTLMSNTSKYYSPDIADGPGDAGGKGEFSPTFGCRCGNWWPAPSHPSIVFRQGFLAEHPNFGYNVKLLKVHLEDTTMQPPVVHWDASYDIRRFFPEGADPNKISLSEEMPAEPGSGTQARFLQFCPSDAQVHQYKLTVTAINKTGAKMQELTDEVSTYQATPPPPKPGSVGGGADALERAKLAKQVAQAEGQIQVAQAEIRNSEASVAGAKAGIATA